VTITGELLKEKHIMKEKRKCPCIHNSEIYDKNKNRMGIVYTIQRDSE
jgi:rRNA processing protein Gar1